MISQLLILIKRKKDRAICIEFWCSTRSNKKFALFLCLAFTIAVESFWRGGETKNVLEDGKEPKIDIEKKASVFSFCLICACRNLSIVVFLSLLKFELNFKLPIYPHSFYEICKSGLTTIQIHQQILFDKNSHLTAVMNNCFKDASIKSSIVVFSLVFKKNVGHMSQLS